MNQSCYRVLVIFSLILTLLFACKTGNDNKTTTTTATSTTTTTTVVYKNGVDHRTIFDVDKQSDDDLRNLMKNLFNSIEEKISMGNFDAWYNAISKSYKIKINDPTVLKTMSEKSDYLTNRDIKLKSPQDFFEYVVIRAREGRILKFYDYQIIDKFHIKVICVLDDKDKFNYNFILEDGSWKLDDR